MDQRPDWDTYFLSVATVVATRTDCRRDRVGAVLVDREHRIYSTGYPGTAPGQPGCLAGACPRGKLTIAECPPGTPYDNCISVHAEINALMRADWDRNPGSTIYITREPCSWCDKVIAASGVIRAVWPDNSRWYTHPPTTYATPQGVTISGGTGIVFGNNTSQTNYGSGGRA